MIPIRELQGVRSDARKCFRCNVDARSRVEAFCAPAPNSTTTLVQLFPGIVSVLGAHRVTLQFELDHLLLFLPPLPQRLNLIFGSGDVSTAEVYGLLHVRCDVLAPSRSCLVQSRQREILPPLTPSLHFLFDFYEFSVSILVLLL